jgi:hypothetical protein
LWIGDWAVNRSKSWEIRERLKAHRKPARLLVSLGMSTRRDPGEMVNERNESEPKAAGMAPCHGYVADEVVHRHSDDSCGNYDSPQ